MLYTRKKLIKELTDLFHRGVTPVAFEEWASGHTLNEDIEFEPIDEDHYLQVYPAFKGFPMLVAEGYTAYSLVKLDSCKSWINANTNMIGKLDSAHFFKIDTTKISIGVRSIGLDSMIIVFQTSDSSGKYWLGFLLFEFQNETIKNIYSWNEAIPKTSNIGCVAEVNYFRTQIPDYSAADITIIDDQYWKRFVFAKDDDGKFIYLKKIQ